jgi:hypothetical protein
MDKSKKGNIILVAAFYNNRRQMLALNISLNSSLF